MANVCQSLEAINVHQICLSKRMPKVYRPKDRASIIEVVHYYQVSVNVISQDHDDESCYLYLFHDPTAYKPKRIWYEEYMIQNYQTRNLDQIEQDYSRFSSMVSIRNLLNSQKLHDLYNLNDKVLFIRKLLIKHQVISTNLHTGNCDISQKIKIVAGICEIQSSVSQHNKTLPKHVLR